MLEYDDLYDYKQLEYDHFDGESFHFLTILDLNKDKDEITVVVQNLGKTSVVTYELKEDDNSEIFFEYGPALEKIYLDEFCIGDYV